MMMKKQVGPIQDAGNNPILSTFTFYEDPGHVWLEVPIKTLMELNINDKISGYSYRSGSKAYLEEDLDAVIFVQAYLKSIGKAADDYK